MTLRLVKFLFILYQLVTRSRYASCRYMPTCSKYAVDAVEKHGTIKGVWFTVKRVSSCHPLSKRPIYDPA